MCKSARRNIANEEHKQRTKMNTVKQNETPVMDAAIEAHATVMVDDNAERTTAAIRRFEGTFALESEVVGATRKRVSKKGAVTLSMLPLSAKDGLPSLKTLSGGKTGKELDAFRMEQLGKFKGNSSALIGRITASPDWNPKSIQMNASGDRVSFVFEREEPVVIVTEKDAIRALAEKHNTTPEKIAEALQLVK